MMKYKDEKFKETKDINAWNIMKKEEQLEQLEK
jgi:hypothetical protein